MIKQLLSLAIAAFAAVPLGVAAAEWSFPEGSPCKLRMPHDPALNYPDGFKATVRFSCDLEKIGKKSHFANLVTKGRDFNDGWSVMVRENGQLLVDLGQQPCIMARWRVK